MAIIPEDIIRRILHFAVDSKSANVDEWTASLPLLAINREWRAIATGRIYNRVLINSSTIEPGEIDVETNITLVEQNGFLSKVSQLYIIECASGGLAGVIAYIAHALPTRFGLQNDISALFSIALREDNDDLVGQDQLFLASYAAGSIAKSIAHYLPSVDYLNILTFYPHPIYVSFMNKLVESFESQLIDLVCNMPANFLSRLRADKLTKLNLVFLARLPRAIEAGFKPVLSRSISLGFT